MQCSHSHQVSSIVQRQLTNDARALVVNSDKEARSRGVGVNGDLNGHVPALLRDDAVCEESKEIQPEVVPEAEEIAAAAEAEEDRTMADKTEDVAELAEESNGNPPAEVVKSESRSGDPSMNQGRDNKGLRRSLRLALKAEEEMTKSAAVTKSVPQESPRTPRRRTLGPLSAELERLKRKERREQAKETSAVEGNSPSLKSASLQRSSKRRASGTEAATPRTPMRSANASQLSFV